MRPLLFATAASVAAALLVGAAPALAPAKSAPTKPAPDAASGAPSLGLDGATLFMERTCFACHGKDAKTPILPEYPRLAGQNAIYAERQMHDIKSGARSNGNTAAMKGIMHLVTDDEIHALAEYVSTLK